MAMNKAKIIKERHLVTAACCLNIIPASSIAFLMTDKEWGKYQTDFRMLQIAQNEKLIEGKKKILEQRNRAKQRKDGLESSDEEGRRPATTRVS